MAVHALVEVGQVEKEPVKRKMERRRQRAVMCIDQGLYLGPLLWDRADTDPCLSCTLGKLLSGEGSSSICLSDGVI